MHAIKHLSCPAVLGIPCCAAIGRENNRAINSHSPTYAGIGEVNARKVIESNGLGAPGNAAVCGANQCASPSDGPAVELTGEVNAKRGLVVPLVWEIPGDAAVGSVNHCGIPGGGGSFAFSANVKHLSLHLTLNHS